MDNTLFIPITILALVVILFILVSLNQSKVDTKKKKRLIESLYKLKEFVSSEELAIRRDTIIKLDNLLSKSLQIYFNNDSTCGENLKNATKIFKKRALDSIWNAHKLRNKIVHNDYAITEEESRKAYETYKMSILRILQ